MSPKSSCRYRGEDVSKLDMIYNDVVNFRALGLVAIIGDLNCRIGNMKDYIDNEYDHNIIMDLPEPINNILDVDDSKKMNWKVQKDRVSVNNNNNNNNNNIYLKSNIHKSSIDYKYIHMYNKIMLYT